MSGYLLDANVLIALCVAEHEHHGAASAWAGRASRFAACPITQGALARFLLRIGESGAVAGRLIASLDDVPVAFIPDDVPFHRVPLTALRGHRQLTDAYLVALARHHGLTLATFDRGLAGTFPAHVELISS